jgi:hypothetical protein
MLILAIYASMIYNVFDGEDTLRGPQMALACRLDAFSQGQKNWAQPPPTFQSNGSACIKIITHSGRINHRRISGFMFKSHG